MNLLNFLSDAIALFFMWLFIRAARHKLQTDNAEYYQQTFADYGVTQTKLASALRYTLGSLELVIAVALIFDGSRTSASIVAALLLSAYLIGMTIQLIQGKRDISCGCSGPNSHIKVSWSLIIRNALLVPLVLTCTMPSAGFASSLWFAVLMTGAFLILTYSCIENLIANAQKISILRTN
ncbi:MauE/DoxX family redox-associated membrane protein [Aliiglaciecola sp. 3_MG-2023]|uniref:MauE/DoxX family redox-associated membrane protein n=1 Tax=unclassified Aliiglaciecola TaxID=2593648 RepID=UPI0026E26230|nr:MULTISPECIES: MauE/DoxX family redox-associated membrane protein [unclassified Aliiglaciecola]MDO6694222.1 MauE/DoxX family redox-associated membrane protein [Aliiglaciecola sp. 3_MG-2023]MDO6709724.1 MauE/DoxX family redox-associated membrane protein [Aliiglaciecola sp. 2_MG-2023]MDO6750734.1 MauE/DoxX family redox-associated membrane protein [Aliiglaciecola sp. 1_MG-2023]